MNRTYPADTCGLLNRNLNLYVFQAITIPSERAVVKTIPVGFERLPWVYPGEIKAGVPDGAALP
jgi:hypothetical protein